MKKGFFKRQVGVVTLSLVPAVMHGQLILIQTDGVNFNGKDDWGATFSIRDIPHHAGDFFNFNTFNMYQPFDVEFSGGWRWNLGEFQGSRKPSEMTITATSKGNITGRWYGPGEIKVKYDNKGRILSYKSDECLNTYEYDPKDGSLANAGYDGGLYAVRVDAFPGYVQSTLNGKPQDVVTKFAAVRYFYDDQLRVVQADFRFTGKTTYFKGVETMDARKITFYYTYDNADNIVKISVKRYMKYSDLDNLVSHMRYDSKNRLIEQTVQGNCFFITTPHRYTYTYDEKGNVVGVEDIQCYDYDLTKTESRYKDKYDIRYDSEGRPVHVQYSGLAHHYGFSVNTDDVWRSGIRFEYTYDRYGNWNSLKLYADASSSLPYSTVIRHMVYGDGEGTLDAGPSDASAAPSFRDVGSETMGTVNQIVQLLKEKKWDEAESAIDRFSKTDETGVSLYLRATLLYHKGDYDKSLEVGKKAFEVLKSHGYDYSVAGDIIRNSAIAPCAFYWEKHGERPDFDRDGFCKLVAKACEALEYLRERDPRNLTNWKSELLNTYRLGANFNMPGYAEKLKSLNDH